jgi:hypothetical protein
MMHLLLFLVENQSANVWDDAWSIFTSPGHIIAEVSWTIIQDVVIIWLLYGTVFKKIILPRLRREIHKEIDEEHNISHDDD